MTAEQASPVARDVAAPAYQAALTPLDEQNSVFWTELCGTPLARYLGVEDARPESLKKFDDGYFAAYPYLLGDVGIGALAGHDVLEIGLGYGSLSQKIAEAGARYCGLDIAPGPVEMVRHRLRQAGLPGRAEQGSILAAPFPDESFDRVISIGCLHMTGDLAGAINECWRVLRPGGSFTLMVYYSYSHRRWVKALAPTLRYLCAETFGYRGVAGLASARERYDFDHNTAGEAAPYTDFISIKSLRSLCRRFSRFDGKLRNISQEGPFIKRTREDLLQTRWPDFVGLDLYATAVK